MTGTLPIDCSDDTSVALLQKREWGHPLPGRAYSFPSTCHLHFHRKITANNSAYGGVHPIIALESHQENLANLISQALQTLPSVGSDDDIGSVWNNDRGVKIRSHDRFPPARPGVSGSSILYKAVSRFPEKIKPDFISVTRGPGMRSSVTTGLDTA